jgi:hypothetical protein
MNSTFLQEFENLVRARDIAFDHEDQHIMCFPHVINICSTHIIEEFTDITLVDDWNEFEASLPPSDPDYQTFNDACIRDPIALCRSAICAIRASGQ